MQSNAVLGEMRISLFELLQREADKDIGHHWLSKIITERYAPKASFLPGDHLLYTPKVHALIGYLNINVHYRECTFRLFRPPLKLRDREEKEFSRETLKCNVDRLRTLIALTWDLEEWYLDLMAWKDLKTSLCCLALFVSCCIGIPSEYAPAYFLFGGTIYLLNRYWHRVDGRYLKSWIEMEDLEERKAWHDFPHRSIGNLSVAVLEADMGIESSGTTTPLEVAQQVHPTVRIEVFYLPKDTEAFSSDSSFLEYVASGPKNSYYVGQTHEVRYGAKPTWRDVSNIVSHLHGPLESSSPASTSLMDRDAVLSNVAFSWPHVPCSCSCIQCLLHSQQIEATTQPPQEQPLIDHDKAPLVGVDHHALRYPILQPSRQINEFKQTLLPWKSLPGNIAFHVVVSRPMYGSVGSGALQKTNVVARFSYPLAKLVASLRTNEETLWLTNEDDDNITSENNTPIRLRVRMQLDAFAREGQPTREDRCFSVTLADWLKHPKAPLSGSIVHAYRKVVEGSRTLRSVQNDLGRFCGAVESWRSLMNWTHPWKTAVMCCGLTLLGVLCYFIPARYLLLVLGLSEFATAFRTWTPPSNRFKNIMWNFLASVPCNEDILQV